MKRIHLLYLLALLFGMTAVMSCSDSEEALTPSNAQDDFFSVPEGADDPVSLLRKDFHEKYGMHLLFNDTLRTQPKTETIDFNYALSDYGSAYFCFEYLDNDIQTLTTATSTFEEKIMPHLSKKILPYSLLLVSKIGYDKYGYEEDMDYVSSVSCFRCLAIAIGDILNASEEEQDGQIKDFLFKMIRGKINVFDDSFNPFTDISSEYNYERISDYMDGWDRSDETIIHDYGFLDYDPDWRDRYERDEFPDQTDDMEDYLEALIYMSETEFEELYGDYPVVMQKYRILRQLVEDMGFVL